MKIKILCDACAKEEAVVFCAADEAAICEKCDHRVHHADKLASKHPRFAFLHPARKPSSLCDICQEKKAFLFCRQDRAILCVECDIGIHAANSLTLKHTRFFLTGIELSATPFFYIPTVNSGGVRVPDGGFSSQPPHELPSPPDCNHHQNNSSLPWISSAQKSSMKNQCTSTFSNYLMEMLPPPTVEDFVDTASTSKIDDEISQFWGLEYDPNGQTFHIPEVPSRNLNSWVPPEAIQPDFVCPQPVEGWENEFNIMTKRTYKDILAVPQFTSHSRTGSKRSRPF